MLTITSRAISFGMLGVVALTQSAFAVSPPPLHQPVAPRTSEQLTRVNRDTGTVVVVKPSQPGPFVQIENLRLETAPPKAPQPSALLKFDVFNDTSLRLTDVVMKVSFVEKTPHDEGTTTARVVVGPVTVRVGEILQAGYVLSYEMLFRNLSADCDCSPNVEVLAARLLPD